MTHDAVVATLSGRAILPEITLWVFACAALLIEWFRPRTLRRGHFAYDLFSAEFVAWVGLLIALALVIVPGLRYGDSGTSFYGSIVHDPLATFYRGLCLLTTIILMASSWSYMRERPNRPEFYGLLLLATSAMILMVQSNDLIMLFLSIEFLSITSYVLVGYLKGNRRSAEASIKYFLFGSICSALMLYGMSLLYGVTGSTNFEFIQDHLIAPQIQLPGPVYLLIVVTFFAGIGFKISMWPFHMWAPDAYEGAPTPVTAFLAVGPKLAGIAVFVRVVQTVLRPEPYWPLVLGIIAMVTMTWGNLAALGQTNIKRLLAYSSIAQAGYLLVGVVSLSVAANGNAASAGLGLTSSGVLPRALEYAAPAVLVYSLAYLVMNLGAFIVAIEVERMTGTADIEGFAGLGERSPLMAASMTIFLLGLAGIPLTVGFIGKLYLFGAAVAGAAYGGSPVLWALAGFGVANSVISVYYYFGVVQPIWLRRVAGTDRTSAPAAVLVLVWILAALTIAFGVFGQAVVRPARQYQSVFHGPTVLNTMAAGASPSEAPAGP